MKSQIKDIVIGIFAVIGFTAIVMGFNNPAEPQQVTYATPESHVWEVIIGTATTNSEGRAYMWNKVTGEIRKISKNYSTAKELGISNKDLNATYIKMYEAE